MGAKMTPEQWAVCDEIAVDMRRLAKMLLTYDLDDPFQFLLRMWAVNLCILGGEMFESVLMVTRAGNVRAGFALSRTLIEYYVRMSYYHKEADKVAVPWRASGELGPAGMSIRETHAYRDWSTATAKLRVHMKKMPDLDFLSLSDQERAAFEALLAEDESVDTRRWWKMRNVAEPDSEARNNFIDAEYGMRSSYLHGDQAAYYEVCEMYDERRGGAPSFVGQFSEHRVAGYAAQYTLMLMQAIEEAVGREFAVSVLGPKLSKLFQPQPLKSTRTVKR